MTISADESPEEDTTTTVGFPSLATETDKGAIQSIERAGQILALFDEDTLTLSVSVVSERLGLNRTTAHRYLQSLQSSGFLDRANAPGPILDQLSAFISGQRKVLTLAPPVMRELADKTGMTVVMSLPGRVYPVVTLVEEASIRTILVTVPVGTVLTPVSAQSRVLVAFQTDQAVVARHLSGFSEQDARAEEAILARIRKERVAWNEQEELGLSVVAAPVFGSKSVQAAVALVSTSKMLPASDRSAPLVRDLQAAAAQISNLVGG